MTSVSVALFTKTFLEPTHHAIASVLERLNSVDFHVFAKRFEQCQSYDLTNVKSRTCFSTFQPLEDHLRGCHLVHAIFDGDIALRAAGIASASTLPLILSFHGGFDTKAKIIDPLYRELTVRAASNAKIVTVVSRGDAARLRAIGVTRKVEIVPVPVDLSIINPATRVRGRLLSIGRLVEKKGFDVAISALKLLPESYTLRIVGEGPCLGRWQRLADDLGVSDRVKWLGSLPLHRCLQELELAWALVHPARIAVDGNTEGVPQVILWAQAAGVPVVTTNVGDISEVVRHHQTGILTEGAPEGIAEAIIAISEPSGVLIKASREQIASHSLEMVVDLWVSLYSEALR